LVRVEGVAAVPCCSPGIDLGRNAPRQLNVYGPRARDGAASMEYRASSGALQRRGREQSCLQQIRSTVSQIAATIGTV